jgi:ABC-type multidrug transport system fused ATPase/permease subunit
MRANKLRQLFSLLKEGFAEYKWQIFGLAALTLLSGLLEGVGINAIIPFFTFLQKNTQETDSITHFIQSVFTFLHLPFTVKFILIFIATLFIIRMVVLFSSSYLSIKTTTGYEKKTRAELFKLAMSGHWEYILSQKVGHLDQVLITDANRSSGLLLHIGQSFLIVAQFIVYSLLIVNISPIIALVVVLAGGFIFFVFKPLFYRNRIASAESAQMYKDLAHFVDEHIIGIKTVKTSAVEPEVIAAGSGFFNRMEFLSARIAMAHSITNISLQPIGIFFIIAVFAFFYKTSAFSIGSFAVFE